MKNFSLFSNRSIFIAMTAAMLCVHGNEAKAQQYEWNVAGITEGAWNMTDKKTGWNNLLEIGGSIGLWKGAKLEATAIGTYQLDYPVVEDIQVFSNISAGTNRAFRLLHGGISQELGKHWLVFAGLRNVDTDYFGTPFTCLFTGSSNGNFPVLSGNFPLGTFPMAALSIHAEYRPCENLTFKETVYNGVADDRLEHQFRIRPDKDGVLNIGSVSYDLNAGKKHEGSYTIGYALGTQPKEVDEEAEMTEDELTYNYALWALAEQNLCKIGSTKLGALLQGGMAPAERSACRYYWGAGLTLGGITPNDGQVGVVVNRAIMADGTETSTELTGHFPVFEHFAIQPAVHCIRTNGHTTFAGLLRLSFEFGGATNKD